MLIPEEAIKIKTGYEGLGGERNGRYFPYHCKADKPGVMTVGIGHLLAPGQKEIKVGGYTIELAKGLTLDQVNDLFKQDCAARIADVSKLAGNCAPHEFGALFSLYYNIPKAVKIGGPGKYHRLGMKKLAAKKMLEYIYSNNQRQRGLWRRRMTEALYYLDGAVIIAKDKASEARLLQALSARLGERIAIPAFH